MLLVSKFWQELLNNNILALRQGGWRRSSAGVHLLGGDAELEWTSRNKGFGCWMSSFKHRVDSGILDMVALQETHAQKAEVPWLEAQFARSRGFRAADGLERRSYWSGAISRGAADGRHVRGTVHTRRNGLDFCDRLRAKGASGARSVLSRSGWMAHAVHRLLVGGDFNCTFDAELDRSNTAAHALVHTSRALSHLLMTSNPVDALGGRADETLAEGVMNEYRCENHTYFYTGAGGAPASSRLDRWYVHADRRRWVVGTEVRRAGCHSDHNGVLLRVADPDMSGWIRRRKKTYLTAALYAQRVGGACARLLASAPLVEGDQDIDAWDSLQTAVRVACLGEARAAYKAKVAGRRRQVRHLRASLRKALDALGTQGPACDLHAEAELVELERRMERLSLNPAGRVTLLRNLIAGEECAPERSRTAPHLRAGAVQQGELSLIVGERALAEVREPLRDSLGVGGRGGDSALPTRQTLWSRQDCERVLPRLCWNAGADADSPVHLDHQGSTGSELVRQRGDREHPQDSGSQVRAGLQTDCAAEW
ncbi:hypothetical protein PybrP1_011274 [[Pythium] brassicae (nom. inval.)]|nr:hypothetical protein PybrP1_011274 [[Pythium] brassicae (nom. inval.)]